MARRSMSAAELLFHMIKQHGASVNRTEAGPAVRIGHKDALVFKGMWDLHWNHHKTRPQDHTHKEMVVTVPNTGPAEAPAQPLTEAEQRGVEAMREEQ